MLRQKEVDATGVLCVPRRMVWLLHTAIVDVDVDPMLVKVHVTLIRHSQSCKKCTLMPFEVRGPVLIFFFFNIYIIF